ncbi:FG-GAP and VCBS repeat-containing protein [Streptomyces sp. NBC_00344]|uniref:FG-GAP and VCBS repeat-containing protein n=1 Tax=Streptomyces sp. NBC_00344 TaxID=2975720 RepID=UPI002E1E583C
MHRQLRTALATAAAAALTGGLLIVTASTASAAPSGAQGDFNGDGYRDIAVVAPLATVNGKAGAGSVSILYGSKSGAGASKIQTVSQNSAGVPGDAEKNDYFGGMSIAGDFDGDGYADLAVGSSGEDVGSDIDGGSVTILWGASGGLSGGNTVKDPSASSHDHFGNLLASGDYNGDGRADLAIASDQNVVDVYRGGFTRAGGTGGHYSVTAPVQKVSGSDFFNLTAGDVNHDGRTDLLVDGFETDSADGWNSNYYLPGSASGVTADGAQKLPAGVISDIGDVNGDGYGDIVIGAQWDAEVPGSHKGGVVTVVYGTANGPDGGQDSINQDSPGVPGAGETDDVFGYELSLGDINGDGLDDLAVGAPGEDLNGVDGAGMVTVLYGSTDGFATTGAQALAQDTPGVPGDNEKGDGFGGDVFLSDTNNDGKADLTVSSPWENSSDGYVVTFNSDGTKLVPTGAGYGLTATKVSAAGTPMLGSGLTG